MRPARFLNVLAAVLLVLLVGLRRLFVEAIGEPGDDHRRLRWMIAPAALVLVAFLALSVWRLVAAGYWAVAVLLVAHVWLLVFAWRRRSDDD